MKANFLIGREMDNFFGKDNPNVGTRDSNLKWLRLVEIGHMTTVCVSIPQSLSAVIKSYKALQLLQLSIYSKTVQIFIQVLVMNSVPLI